MQACNTEPVKALLSRISGCACRTLLASGFAAISDADLSAQVAFNDFAPGVLTHSNATTYGPGQAGVLKNITNGAVLPWTVTVTGNSYTGGGVQGNPTYGTPASIIFDEIGRASCRERV